MTDQSQDDASARKASSAHTGRAERPIVSRDHDLLERTEFVRRLCDAVINPQTKTATGVVVGITGPWGSGKSSVLNLLAEYISVTYGHALVVRFDPWLVSGRNDLISEFISELIRTIKADPQLKQRFRKVADAIAKYGEHLAPIAGSWIPLLGSAVKGGSQLIREALKGDESLASLRRRLVSELFSASTPVIVLIDELDRVEDDEIRTVAQLVRSVADFPGISYVLAYDTKRVIQALGTGLTDEQRDERGRAYLEKIVQLQIPLPVTLGAEINRLFIAELSALQTEVQLPTDFLNIERFKDLQSILTSDLIQTPRDVARLVGTFHILSGMLRREVDWIDLLGYCTLLVKAPQTAEVIKARPEDFCDELLTENAVFRRMVSEKTSTEERLKAAVPQVERSEGVKRLIGFLFPGLSETSRREDDRPEALHHRRPLLTTLRLGLLPGDYPRSAIESLVSQETEAIAQLLKEAFDRESLPTLIDRLDDLYNYIGQINHVRFWKGVGLFLRKPNCEWPRYYSPTPNLVQSFGDVLERQVLRSESFRSVATTIFSNLRNDGEAELIPYWLRGQIFRHGLYQHKAQSQRAEFLNPDQTAAIALDLCRGWRSDHLSGTLIPCRWSLRPVYTMLDTGVWDDPCRNALDQVIMDDRALDGFTLMLYGGGYMTDKESVERMCSYDAYIARVEKRLAAQDIHETVRVALTKAQTGGW